ncbi:hypothetical protein CHS0354_008619 [Potamilus streckersoni]|uniref:Uncharacterized protein n=1 Tax=Potamilus streckersoni TaxID=2493646 RepID=A0AAE0SVV4_9BIVA|nr:hypothetical protein CHS0354_008619 [Potamilus streckersoni]
MAISASNRKHNMQYQHKLQRRGPRKQIVLDCDNEPQCKSDEEPCCSKHFPANREECQQIGSTIPSYAQIKCRLSTNGVGNLTSVKVSDEDAYHLESSGCCRCPFDITHKFPLKET